MRTLLESVAVISEVFQISTNVLTIMRSAIVDALGVFLVKIKIYQTLNIEH